ncbi:hypothetical protein HK101_005372 [Irineochytrium annulatum]|nr:hypothetical protein HK101_005372 [Irineochytrium annulatum]
MVVVVVKRNEEAILNLQVPAATRNRELIDKVCELFRLKIRLLLLIDFTGEILQHGVMRPESEIEEEENAPQGESSSSSVPPPQQQQGQLVVRGGREVMINPDPSGRRTGECPTSTVKETLEQTLEVAKALVAKEHAKAGKYLELEELKEAMRNIGGALTIAYPMGLPEWEPARHILDDGADLSSVKEIIEPHEGALWWAGKELVPEKLLSDFVGRNDKTKIIAKLQKKEQGPPTREPPLDEQGQKELMAYYYKKQEQEKRLAENADDEYLNSTWANPKTLKQAFTGINNVSWGPR